MKMQDGVYFEILPNGLTLLLRETHLAPVADIQIWAQVGAADERPGQLGLAHFHEHMLFKGTERRGLGDVAGEIEGAGGRVNAYTSYDVTVYYATLPSDALSVGLDVLTDAVRFSSFDPAEIEREIEVVLEEIRRSEDSPGHVLSEAVFREHFREHPYGSPILGPAASVASFNRERVSEFWNAWYASDNLVVVAAGDFSAPELAREIAEQFEGAEPGAPKRNRRQESPQTSLRTTILQRPFERIRVDLLWPSAAFREEDASYLDLLAFSLGECESSRLARRVRDDAALVDRIDASAYAPLDPGTFSIDFECDEERISEAISACSREVARLHQEPVSQQELDRARINFLASEHFERESVSGLASKLGNFHVVGGDWRSEQKYFETLKAATPEDLQRVAKKYLKPEQLTVGVLLPEGEAPCIDAAGVERAVDQGSDQCRKIFVPPSRTDATAKSAKSAKGDENAKRDSSPPKTQGPEIHSYDLSSGVALYVVPRREIPVVAVRAACLGGLLAQDDETAGISHFLTSTWLRGTRSRSAADYARAVEDLAAEIDGFSGRSTLGLTLDVAREKFEPALELFSEVLLEPGLAPDDIERERRETLATLERMEDQLAARAFALFTRTLFEQHPYRLPSIGTKESVSGIDGDMLRAHHAQLIAGNNMVIAVSGDVDPDDTAAQISRQLSALPAGASFKDSLPALEPGPTQRREASLSKERAQAHLVMGFRGIDIADPDRAALDVISQLLAGQSGRLFLELRDKRGLAYSVSAMNVEGYAPGFFSVYIATAPEKVDEARSGMIEQLELLVAAAPNDDELGHAKRHLIGNHAISQQRNAAHAAHISLDALYGLGPDASRGYPGEIAAVQKGDVLRVARRVIDLDRCTVSLISS